jgi:hypothetical protein
MFAEKTCLSEATSYVIQSHGWNCKEKYCATNSGSPEVELRFWPWLILFQY